MIQWVGEFNDKDGCQYKMNDKMWKIYRNEIMRTQIELKY